MSTPRRLDKALERTIAAAQERNIRLWNERVEAEEQVLMDDYTSDIESWLALQS